MKRSRLVAVFAGLFCLIAATIADAAPRGFALVVGIDPYRDVNPGLPDLAFAERDARAIGEYFAAQGYQVQLLLGSRGNAGKPDLMHAVQRLAETITADDRFVFSFSGHGITEERDGVKLGYLGSGPINGVHGLAEM